MDYNNEHLTFEEIIEFVSLKKIDDDALELAVKVNSHIRRCPECLKTVRAFQRLYDEFEKACVGGRFEEYAIGAISADNRAEMGRVCESIVKECEAGK